MYQEKSKEVAIVRTFDFIYRDYKDFLSKEEGPMSSTRIKKGEVCREKNPL